MKRIIPLTILIFALFLFLKSGDGRGDVFSTVTQSFNDEPLLRVVSHYEDHCFIGVCGSIHVFQSYRDGAWREITSYRHDEPIDVDGKRIRIISENVFYFGFGSKYGVTTDGGKTWSVWNAEKDLPDWKRGNYSLIKDVQIEETGVGKMELETSNKKASFLRTEDFGKTWR